MGVAPEKIIFVVILYFEVVLVWIHQYYYWYQKSKQTSVRKNYNLGIIVIKSRETRALCRYSSRHAISIIQLMDWIRYWIVHLTALVSLLFIAMIPIDREITNFPYTYRYLDLQVLTSQYVQYYLLPQHELQVIIICFMD